MDTQNIKQNAEAQGRLPDVAGYALLTLSERRQIVEVLERRSNDIASFKSDLEEKISTEAGKHIRFQDFPGSVEMALSREIWRLRRLAEKIKPVSVEEDDDDA